MDNTLSDEFLSGMIELHENGGVESSKSVAPGKAVIKQDTKGRVFKAHLHPTDFKNLEALSLFLQKKKKVEKAIKDWTND
jgi:hypothetical protein